MTIISMVLFAIVIAQQYPIPYNAVKSVFLSLMWHEKWLAILVADNTISIKGWLCTATIFFAALIAIFIFDVVCSAFMISKFWKLHKKNEKILSKETAILSAYYGATMGLLLWGYIFGIAVGFASGNFGYIQLIGGIGSAISLLPCIKGISMALNMKK